ncbi:MAG: TIGR00730 family Rossman fold protein [Alphaproteobacteria bacterium]
MKSICVFCGASTPKDPIFIEDAKKLGNWIGTKGHRLVYGGGGTGLMGEVAGAVMKHHNNILGVTTNQIASFEAPIKTLKTIFVDSIQDRKEKMIEESDVFVVLAGGIGTIDEISDVLVDHEIGAHEKPLFLVNTKGYYNPFIAWLDTIHKQGLISDRTKKRLKYDVVDIVEEVFNKI